MEKGAFILGLMCYHSCMTKSNKNKGFTLIELLVVITIIALLTGFIMSSMSQSRMRARDAKRISDISQIQLAIEQYFDRCQQYPTSIYNDSSNNCPTNTSIKLANFISKVPTDSAGSQYGYSQNSNLDYVLHASLELTNEATKDGLSSAPNWVSGFSCSDAYTTSKDYCVGPR